MMRPAARQPVAVAVVIGMALTTVALATRERLAEQTLFGLPGDAVTGGLFGLAIGIMLVAILKAGRAR